MISKIINRLRLRRERKNQFESTWLRQFFKATHGISAGLYSYGCFDPVRISRGTVIGRYCSFSSSCRLLNGNHGLDFLSLHPYLYNTSLGIVEKETIKRTSFVVEDDVWIGENALILPSAERIGRGAVIAAGAVVTRPVQPYEIVGGVPATTIRFRFDPWTIERIEETKWWLWSKAELKTRLRENPNLIYGPFAYFRARNNSIDDSDSHRGSF